MHDLFVVEPEIELPNSQPIACVCHSETGEILKLVMAPDLTIEGEVEPPSELYPGTVIHESSNHSYFIFAVVAELSTTQAGVWYCALYKVAGVTPHFFRPLHTPDGKGWLDRVEGEPRFRRGGHNRRWRDQLPVLH